LRQHTVQCLGPHGLHRMAYTEWGDAANPRVLVCVHGLTRNGRDFDFLAAALADEFRVVCPDVVGRGVSDRLKVPDDYQVPIYVQDMVTLLARLDVASVSWLGTSMGGLIGMALAAQPDTPIRRLILNDVGPLITAASIKRIGEYLGAAPRFESIEHAEAYTRQIAATFGNLTDAQWRHLTIHTVRRADDGRYEMVYDPAIAEPFRKAMGDQDVDLWPVYQAVRCPTLLMRGADSDLLTHPTAEEMTQRGPRARLVEVPGVGHAPMLMDEFQIRTVRDFLLERAA
jgi:pimeloyl-ACP methyl ester carboxylesterase